MAASGLSSVSRRMLQEVRATVGDLQASSEPGKPLSSGTVEKLRSLVYGLKQSIGLREKCRPSEDDQDSLWQIVCDLWVCTGLHLLNDSISAHAWRLLVATVCSRSCLQSALIAPLLSPVQNFTVERHNHAPSNSKHEQEIRQFARCQNSNVPMHMVHTLLIMEAISFCVFAS